MISTKWAISETRRRSTHARQPYHSSAGGYGNERRSGNPGTTYRRARRAPQMLTPYNHSHSSSTFGESTMNRAPYTTSDDVQILQLRERGVSYAKVGRALGRSEDAVKSRHRLLTDYHNRQPKYLGCAGLVSRQIATGQYNPVAHQIWQERHA